MTFTTFTSGTYAPFWSRLRRKAAKTGFASVLIGTGAALHAAFHALPLLHAGLLAALPTVLGGAAHACSI